MLGGTTSGSVSCRGGAGSIGATTSTRFGRSMSGGGDPGRNEYKPPSADVTASFDNVKTSGVSGVTFGATGVGTAPFGNATTSGGTGVGVTGGGGGACGNTQVAAAITHPLNR